MRLPAVQTSLQYTALPEASHGKRQPANETAPWSGWSLMRLPRGLPHRHAEPQQPPKVALQIGHEDVANHPPELRNLRWNTGGYADGIHEVDINRR